MSRTENRVWCIWLNEAEKIASFHAEGDYQLMDFLDYNQYQSYIMALQNSGYRFQ